MWAPEDERDGYDSDETEDEHPIRGAEAGRRGPLERRLADAPAIAVPAITLEGDANGEGGSNGEGGIGHNLPQEAPQAFVTAVVDVDGF